MAESNPPISFELSMPVLKKEPNSADNVINRLASHSEWTAGHNPLRMVTGDDGKTGYISHTRARDVDNLF
jgi:hypothetical protein